MASQTDAGVTIRLPIIGAIMAPSRTASLKRVFVVAEDSPASAALSATLQMWFELRVISVSPGGILEHPTRVISSISENLGSAGSSKAIALLDASFSETLRRNGVAFEVAILIRRQLQLPAIVLSLGQPDLPGIFCENVSPYGAVVCILRGHLLLAELLRNINQVLSIDGAARSAEEERAIESMLRTLKTERLRFLLHELQARKPLPTAIANATSMIRDHGLAKEPEREALASEWRHLRDYFGGPFVGIAVTDTDLNNLRPLVGQLESWVERVRQGDHQLVFNPNEGTDAFRRLVTAVQRLVRPLE